MADLEAFRADLRRWLDANAPQVLRGYVFADDGDANWGGKKASYAIPELKQWLDVMAARGFTAEVAMTGRTHVSGTDRIAEVAATRGWRDDDIVVNVQGDEPLIPPAVIDQVAALLHAHARADIATLAARIDQIADLNDPNNVKVACDAGGRALYFSRAPIPWNRDAVNTLTPASLRHIGIYAYRVAALRRLASLPASRLEQIEKLEQLRALENGMEIRVALACERPLADVNTAADLERAERALSVRP